MRRAIASAFALYLVGYAGSAGAQESFAEQLFLQGRQLMNEQKYAEACAKFKKAHDIDPSATGTLLNLAICHETIGKTATAWAEFRRARAESLGKREDRVTLAKQHEEALLPKLSYVKIMVPPEVDTPGLVLRLDDGAGIEQMTWGTEFPIDPGTHTIVASARSKIDRVDELTIGPENDHVVFELGPLADAPPPPPPSVTKSEDRAGNPRRVLGYAVGGVGLATIAVGAVFGISAASRGGDIDDACPNQTCPNPEARNANRALLSDARTAATLSTVLVGVGAAAVVAGVVLVVTSSPKKAQAALRSPGVAF